MNPQHYTTYGGQPPQQQQQQQFYGRTGSAGFGAQFATAGRAASLVGGGGMAQMPLNAWSPPSPQEHQYYDMLFAAADEEKRDAIGGRIAVAFFSRSGIDKLHLREIWTIADSQQRSELSRNEFYVAMRLIALAQRGEPVSAQRFYELASTPFPLPTIEGVSPPPAAPVPQATMHQAPLTGQPKGSYAITDEEKQRYDGIFQQYDTDHDGYLHGGEAVQLFGMSGLDRGVLRDIWALADRDQDSRLDTKEFYIAMHLIVCISKRGLPLPTELPADMAQSVFGNRGSFNSSSTAPFASLGGFASAGNAPSRTNSMSMGGPGPAMQAPPGAAVSAPVAPQSSSQDPMDAFAGLSPAIEIAQQASRIASFGRTSSGSSQVSGTSASSSMMAGMSSDPTSSLEAAMASMNVSTPSPAARGSFGAGSTGPSATGSLLGSSHLGMSEQARDRAGSTSSVSSFASVATDSSAAHGAGGLPHGAPPMSAFGAMGSFHGHDASMPMAHQMGPSVAAPPPKPFLSDEAESAAVRQLDQSNDDVMQALESVEKKQHAIELLSEKLRELDQLRHELVTLSMKRESLRASSATSGPPTPPQNAVETQAIRGVEQTLRDLVDGEKTAIQKLHSEIAQHEAELLQQESTLLTPSVLSVPPLSAALDVGLSPAASPASKLSTPPPPPPPSAFVQADTTPKNGFEAFGDFGSSSPAPTAKATPFGSDAFANFNFS